MKKILNVLLFGFMATIISGCVSESRVNVEKSKIHVRSFIDGADALFVRGDNVWLKHFAYDRPGQWRNVNEPSYVNGDKWLPVWKKDSEMSDQYTIPSGKYALPENMAFDETTLSVDSFGAWGKVSVLEYPNATNKFTLAVLIDDSEYDGASWYNIGIDWVE